MKKKTVNHRIDGLVALLLFAIFAVCVLAVLLTGANTYRRLSARDSVSYDRRTSIQYIATRVRQAESVKIDNFGDSSALLLGSGEYITRVYLYEGYIMELYAESDLSLLPEAGERVMPANSLELSLDDRLLTINTVDEMGEASSLLLLLRAEGDMPI